MARSLNRPGLVIASIVAAGPVRVGSRTAYHQAPQDNHESERRVTLSRTRARYLLSIHPRQKLALCILRCSQPRWMATNRQQRILGMLQRHAHEDDHPGFPLAISRTTASTAVGVTESSVRPGRSSEAMLSCRTSAI